MTGFTTATVVGPNVGVEVDAGQGQMSVSRPLAPSLH